MRIAIFITFLLLFSASGVLAQAADEDAINFSAKMDTVAKWTNEYNVLGAFNIGLQNGDEWEDFEIFQSPDGKSYNISRIRMGGSSIFDSINNPAVFELPTSCVDLDGDGIKDLVTDNFWWHKGKNSYPYYDSTSNVILSYHDFPSLSTIGVDDYNNDGFHDLLVAASLPPSLIYRFNGGTTFGSTSKILPSDSILLPYNYHVTVGKFTHNLPPIIVLARGKEISIIRHIDDLKDDSTVLISDTTANGITVSNLYSMDITDDGVADLIVADGFNIYIFKGDDIFGTYLLSPQTAYYHIKSPHLLDFGNYGFVKNFGMTIRSCGDITGSGIPYLAVAAETNESGFYEMYQFFYAGGKALDSLFDASLSYPNQYIDFNDTLHSINSTGRTACLLNNGRASGGFGNELMLFKDCEKIPHKTNPLLRKVREEVGSSLAAIVFPAISNNFVKLNLHSSGQSKVLIETFDLLGRKFNTREVTLDAGNNTEYYDTSAFPDGTYIFRIVGHGKELEKKFIIHH